MHDTAPEERDRPFIIGMLNKEAVLRRRYDVAFTYHLAERMALPSCEKLPNIQVLHSFHPSACCPPTKFKP